jgi:hypothetical protein
MATTPAAAAINPPMPAPVAAAAFGALLVVGVGVLPTEAVPEVVGVTAFASPPAAAANEVPLG